MKKKSPLRAYIEKKVTGPYPGTVIINIHRFKGQKYVSINLANNWMLFAVLGWQKENGDWDFCINEMNAMEIQLYNEWRENKYGEA